MKNRIALMIGALILGLSAMTVAQDQPAEDQPAQEQSDVPTSVGRISLIHGDVSTQRGDSGDWATVVLNQPIVSSDKVSTGVNSRAEVQLDHGNIVRLGDNTLAGIAGLSRNQIQIQVDRGLIDYSVFKGSDAAVEIDTANVAVRPDQRDGVYRIEVNSEGETSVIVRKGSAQISTPQGSTQVEQGQMAIVRGVGDDTQYKLENAPSKDSWDSWNIERDHTILNAQSWKNTNRYYVGSEDLDTYGRWVTVPDYGPVWSPAAGPGWAPYRSGRWVWEPGFGWTWVSYEPWGWAPYHYGRWFVYNSSWVWWPGPAYGYPRYRPVWAPAYVSFFGFGGGVGVGVGFGSVGWLPIGPCDSFYPWYGRYRSHYNVVNVTNINVYNNRRGFGGIAPLRRGGAYSNVRLASMNSRVREGISTVPSGHFGTGRSAAVAVNGEVFRSGRRIEGNLPVVPTRAALSASNRPAAASTIPRGGTQQRFFEKSRPAARPRSFDNEVSRMRQSIQRDGAEHAFARSNEPGQNSANNNGRGSVARPTPGVRTNSSGMQQAERGATSRENQGFERFGSGPAQNRSRGESIQTQGGARGTMSSPASNGGGARPSTSDSSGWRKFSNSTPAQRSGGMSRTSERSSSGMSNVPRPGNSPRPEASSNGGDWRHFTPQSAGSPDRMNNRMSNGGGMNGRGADSPRYEMSRPQMESVGGRGMAQPASRGYSRPPLEMRQPIVTPRGGEGGGPRMSAPSHGGGGGGGNRGGGGGGGGGSHGGPHGGGGRH
ncbi:MAG: DUF6600 domain-containing protein [Terriglobales bacterium]